MAWINAIPNGETKPRSELNKQPEGPEEIPCEYLIDYFKILRNGSAEITFTELVNFEKQTGISLTPNESSLLVEMGWVYRNFLQKAFDPKCPNPYATEENQQQSKMISIKSYMASVRIRQQRKKRK